MFTAEYEVLVRSRQAELLREAERERLVAEMKTQQTAGTSYRRWAAWLSRSLVKWGKRLNTAYKEPSLLYRHHES